MDARLEWDGFLGFWLVFFGFHEVLNFLKNDGKMFKYSKRLDDVLIFESIIGGLWFFFILDEVVFILFLSYICI
jgi:hypothetical protein